MIGRDIVFVTDVSGSMAGQPLQQSKRGLRHALSQLSARDRFGVVAFDDERGDDGRPRASIFLTDGQGSTPPEVVASEVRARARGTRIYSFGAGDGVNRFFRQRLAEDNRGIATFVQRDQDIEREMRPTTRG